MVSTAFFILTKIVGVLFRLETLLVLLGLLALWTVWRDRRRLALGALSANLAVLLITAIWPIGNLTLAPLERTYPANPTLGQVEGIIVLGGAEYSGTRYSGGLPQVNAAGERFIGAIALANQYPDAVVLWSGGRATPQIAGDGYRNAGPKILRSLGLPQDRLLIEQKSRNTTENARFSRALAPQELTGQWLLVTSGFHMRRSVATFCEAGWTNLVPWPVDHRVEQRRRPQFARNLMQFNIGLREWIGIAGYAAAGKLADPAQGNCLSEGYAAGQ